MKTTDGGENWVDKSFAQNLSFNDVDFIDTNIGIAVGINYSSNAIIFKTTDGGENWINQFESNAGGDVLSSVSFADENHATAIGGVINGGYGIVVKTTDGGQNWNYYSLSTCFFLNSIFLVDANLGWAVGNYGAMDGLILKTNDGGVNWNIQLMGTNGNPSVLNDVYFSDENIGTAVGESGTILKTTNGGQNWFSQYSSTANRLEGVSFTDPNSGMSVGLHGTILKTTNGGVIFVEEETIATQPNIFLLSQNYPNPFNPSTRIQYSVNSTQNVTLKVYDLLGREIVTLVNEEKPAGEYEVAFNSQNLPSGIYFYQLRIGDYSVTKKMVLIR